MAESVKTAEKFHEIFRENVQKFRESFREIFALSRKLSWKFVTFTVAKISRNFSWDFQVGQLEKVGDFQFTIVSPKLEKSPKIFSTKRRQFWRFGSAQPQSRGGIQATFYHKLLKKWGKDSHAYRKPLITKNCRITFRKEGRCNSDWLWVEKIIWRGLDGEGKGFRMFAYKDSFLRPQGKWRSVKIFWQGSTVKWRIVQE